MELINLIGYLILLDVLYSRQIGVQVDGFYPQQHFPIL